MEWIHKHHFPRNAFILEDVHDFDSRRTKNKLKILNGINENYFEKLNWKSYIQTGGWYGNRQQ